MEGVDTGGSRVQKSRRASELSLERAELGHVTVEAALHQVVSSIDYNYNYEPLFMFNNYMVWL